MEGGLYPDGLIIGCIFCLHVGGPITGGLINGWAYKQQFTVWLEFQFFSDKDFKLQVPCHKYLPGFVSSMWVFKEPTHYSKKSRG